ncbi:MAG: type II secretion system protein N [Pseudomonadota bacterium]
MIATMPASVFLKNRVWRSGVAGTVWNGEVGVAGDARFEWRWAPLRSLMHLAYATDWKATGPNTDLGGQLIAGIGGMRLENVSGRADFGLVKALQPTLAFACDMTMQVELAELATGGGNAAMQGRVATEPGSCQPRSGGTATAVPALLLNADHIGDQSRIRLTPMAQRRKILVDASIDRQGTLDLTVTPDGATALPFLGVPPGARIQGQM